MQPGDVSAAWEDNAEQWLAWARTPGQDVYYFKLNLPAFEALLPPPGKRTLDVGCGEGRLGGSLTQAGHRVTGIDSSRTLATAARELGGYDEIVIGDAARLPWPANHFDLAVAFMTLHDMPRPATVIREVARVLEPSGLFCLAIIHPLNRPTEAIADYFSERRFSEVVSRNGIEMTFDGIDRPLQNYTLALTQAGFVIEDLREPRATPAAVASAPDLAPAGGRPFFLHQRCRLEHADLWRTATPILETERLILEPLRVDHATEMAPLLDDVRLHRFTGGRPATPGELLERYARQVTGSSPDGRQRWLNWIVRRRCDGLAAGFVQATVTESNGTAELAWTIAEPYQRRGYAREAAGSMAAWLATSETRRLVACVNPEHDASAAVARALGLTATREVRDGETVWARDLEALSARPPH
jgi:RimJ/RimL family protein N-acetyltransferase/2-polyprenyl-3-methyl-5-hydroxy-6-metoxy-1,4-benzoquinol methylase